MMLMRKQASVLTPFARESCHVWTVVNCLVAARSTSNDDERTKLGNSPRIRKNEFSKNCESNHGIGDRNSTGLQVCHTHSMDGMDVFRWIPSIHASRT